MGRAKPAPYLSCHGKEDGTEKNTDEQRMMLFAQAMKGLRRKGRCHVKHQLVLKTSSVFIRMYS